METYIKSIQSNIRGGLAFELAKLTLFHGDSRTGKTMRVRAVQIAADGGASDMQGRAWVKDQRLHRLAPEGEDLVIEGTLVRGDQEQEIRFDKEDAQRPPSVVMGFERIKEALCGSPEKALEFLSPWMETTQEELLDLLPKNLRDAYIEVAATLPGSLTPLQKLHHVTDAADKAMREANKAVKAAQGALDVLKAEDVPTKGDEEDAYEALQMAKKRVAAIEDKRAAALEQRASGNNRTQLAQTLKEATDRYKRLSEERNRAQSAVSLAEKRIAEVDPKIEKARIAVGKAAEAQESTGDKARIDAWASIKTFARQHIEAGATKCALCGSSPDGFQAHLAARVAQAEAQLGAFEERTRILAEGEKAKHALELSLQIRESAKREVESAQASIARLDQELAAIKEQGTKTRALLAELPEEGEDGEEAPTVDLRSEMQAAIADQQAASSIYERIVFAREQAAQASGIREAVESNQEASDTMKRLKAASKKAAQEAAQACTAGLEKRVSAFLPKGMTFGFSADPVRWGLRADDGTINEFLSGAETVVVLSALAFAFAASHPNLFVLVVPEERFIDAGLLARTMRHWAKVAPDNAQIVLTNGVKPKGRIPAAWHVEEVHPLTLDEDEDDA